MCSRIEYKHHVVVRRLFLDPTLWDKSIQGPLTKPKPSGSAPAKIDLESELSSFSTSAAASGLSGFPGRRTDAGSNGSRSIVCMLILVTVHAR